MLPRHVLLQNTTPQRTHSVQLLKNFGHPASSVRVKVLSIQASSKTGYATRELINSKVKISSKLAMRSPSTFSTFYFCLQVVFAWKPLDKLVPAYHVANNAVLSYSEQ